MVAASDRSERAKGPRRAAAKKSDAGKILTDSTVKSALETAQQEARYRLMFEHSTDAIQLVTAGRRVLYSSESVRNILGYTPAELQGIIVDPFVHPDDMPKFKKSWHQLISKQGRTVSLQYRVRHRNGEWLWVETTASNHLDTPDISAVVGNFRNITRRKNAEIKLQESEARMRFMAESMPQMIFTVTSDNIMDYFSPQWADYTGIPLKKILADFRMLLQVIHPDDREMSTAVWRKAFDEGIPIEYQYRLLRKDGTYRWHICRARPMKDEHGSVKLWVGSCTDVDDLQRAMSSRHELELKTAALNVQRAELLALNRAKDEFISLASHQLRTPATGVKQYLGMLLQGFAGSISDDQRAFLQTAYDSNERQIAIVNDLLQVARIDAGKVKLRRRKVNIVRLVKQVINEHATDISRRQQRVIIKGGDQAINARVDSDSICMVIDNILDNATKYTPSDKAITVTIAEDKTVGKVVVSIADQGIGMSSADTQKIFQKFSRLESPLTKSVDGSGLGLYWAKRIVELHGGDITVRSRPRRGTTFSITLPV